MILFEIGFVLFFIVVALLVVARILWRIWNRVERRMDIEDARLEQGAYRR